MADKEFKLPSSSITEIKKLMIAYAKSKNPSSLADVNKLTGINTTIISSNNGFLDSINAIQGGNSKEATPIGKKLGLAFANNIESEVSTNLKQLLTSTEFIESMITALEIKPRTSEDFQSHIAYSLGKEYKGRMATGTGTLVELLELAGIIEEKEGLLYPKNNAIKDDVKDSKVTATTDNPKAEVKETKENNPSLTQQITKNLGSNVTLNINIQLTIPETENEKVYESFFEAMKKHLLS
jgi:hypothetical protein